MFFKDLSSVCFKSAHRANKWQFIRRMGPLMLRQRLLFRKGFGAQVAFEWPFRLYPLSRVCAQRINGALGDVTGMNFQVVGGQVVLVFGGETAKRTVEQIGRINWGIYHKSQLIVA